MSKLKPKPRTQTWAQQRARRRAGLDMAYGTPYSGTRTQAQLDGRTRRRISRLHRRSLELKAKEVTSGISSNANNS